MSQPEDQMLGHPSVPVLRKETPGLCLPRICEGKEEVVPCCVSYQKIERTRWLKYCRYVEDLERQSSLAKSPLPSIQAVVSPEQPSGSLGPASETQSDRRSGELMKAFLTLVLLTGFRSSSPRKCYDV